MKIFLSILSAFALAGTAVKKENTTLLSHWVVESNSSLYIKGSSNINTFTCDITEYLKKDTLTYNLNERTNKLNFNNSSLSIDINSFDCHQRYITADLRKTLKADENPALKIRFIDVDNFDGKNQSSKVNATIDIILAGVTKRVSVAFTLNREQGGKLELSGDKDLSFSDFGLTPPRKLAGLIRINEKIKVHFQLELKMI